MAYLAILVYFSFSTIVSSIDSLYFLGDFWSVLIWIKIHIFAQIQIIMPGMVCHARLFTIYSCLVHKIFTFKSGRLFLILRNWGEVHVFHCRVCTRVCTVAYKKPPKPCGSRGLSVFHWQKRCAKETLYRKGFNLETASLNLSGQSQILCKVHIGWE